MTYLVINHAFDPLQVPHVDEIDVAEPVSIAGSFHAIMTYARSPLLVLLSTVYPTPGCGFRRRLTRNLF